MLLFGTRIGELTVLDKAEPTKWREQQYWTVCTCGRISEKTENNLTNGSTKKCGACYWDRKFPAEYRAWEAMRTRCNNPNSSRYKDYGGAGIKVCAAWNSFAQFLCDMGPKPFDSFSLDRYPNNKGNYEPGNVRWASRRDQELNKSR